MIYDLSSDVLKKIKKIYMSELDSKLFIPRIKIILPSFLEFDYPVLSFFFKLAVFFVFFLHRLLIH